MKRRSFLKAFAGAAVAAMVVPATLAKSVSRHLADYDGGIITIGGGTGAGQSRMITAYDPTTSVATLARDWMVMPDASSTYLVRAHGAWGDGDLDAVREALNRARAREVMVLPPGAEFKWVPR